MVYFDAVYVVFLQLAMIAKVSPISELKENVFSCLNVYASFAEAAIAIGNSRGAALAVIRLRETYDKLTTEGLTENAKEGVSLLVRLAGIAARHKEKLAKVEFLGGKSIHDYLIDVVAKSPFRDTVARAMWEGHVRLESDWDFVVDMGKRLHTNFGFMFDPDTGELYPPDDPRRA